MKEQYYNNIKKEIESLEQEHEKAKSLEEKIALGNQMIGLRKAQQVIIKSYNDW